MRRKPQLEPSWERGSSVQSRSKPRPESGLRPKSETSSLAPEVRAAESRIRELTGQLRGPVGEAGILYHAQIGATVLALVYGGNLEAWRMGAKRDLSVRQLAEQLADVLPQSALYRALSIYEVLLRHAPRFPGIRSLGVRALSAIARAPDDAQVTLIESALDGRWTGTRIENHVRNLPKRNNGGRPRKAQLQKALARLATTLAMLEAAPLEELDAATLRKCSEEAYDFANAFDRLLLELDKAARSK
jgi:hypothetical protein